MGNGKFTFFNLRSKSLDRNFTVGFSLVEVVISIMILTIGLLGSMQVFPVGLRASRRAEVRTRAALVAQRTIESLKLLTWEELVEETTTEPEEDFEVTTTISRSNVEELVDPKQLKVIEVTVGWEEGTRTAQLSFVTYVRQEGS